MEGKEVRKILQEHCINLAWLAEQLGISPQGLNSRLNAHLFKSSYLQEITNILQKDIFGIGTKPNMQPILNIRVRDNITKELSTTNFPVIEYVSIPAFAGCLGFIYYGKDAAPKYEAGDICKCSVICRSFYELLNGRRGCGIFKELKIEK